MVLLNMIERGSVCICMCVCMFSQLKIEDMLFIQGSYSFSVLVEW